MRLVFAAIWLFVSLAAAAQPLGDEFRVSPNTAGDQNVPNVGASVAGFVVAWTDFDGDATGIFARRFDVQGSALTGQFRVNTVTAHSESLPRVAMNASGAFVVVWQRLFGGGEDSLAGIVGQRYAASGAPVGTEFHVNQYTLGDQSDPVVAMANDGTFVVIWSGEGDGDTNGIFARRYTAGGAPASDEFRVNGYVSGAQDGPRIGLNTGSGDFLVVWHGTGETDGVGINAQRYASTGAPLGDEFRVNTSTTTQQAGCAVAALPSIGLSNAFVVSWGEAAMIHAQRYSESHGAFSASGPEFVVGAGGVPTAAMDGNGDFVLAQINSDAVTARFFDSTGFPIAPAVFRVNTYTTGVHAVVSAGTLGRGKHILVWKSVGQDGDAGGVYAQMYNRNGDADGDGALTVADVFYLINYLFAGGPAPLSPTDVNGSSTVDVADVFYLINFLFAGGPRPT
jgi:hypothetical protein